MKKLFYLFVVFLMALLFLPATSAFAKTTKVPITYEGDTAETISRRAQWIEGARNEGSLVYWGTSKPYEASKLIAEFNKIYPFIKVIYWRGRGEEIATKLETEYAMGRSAVDVFQGGGPHNYSRWAEMGIIEIFTDIVPGIEKYDKRMYSKPGYSVMPALAPKVPQFNTNLVSEEEAPKNWKDLLDPKWKGQLAAEVDPSDWATLALAEGGWGVERTEDFLFKLKQQKPRFIRGGSAMFTMLVAGEHKISAMGNLRFVIQNKKRGAPVDWIKADPILVTGSSILLSKNAVHPNAARLYLEWQLSRKGLLHWANVIQNYVPGINTPIATLLDDKNLVIRDENVHIKTNELNLIERFSKVWF